MKKLLIISVALLATLTGCAQAPTKTIASPTTAARAGANSGPVDVAAQETGAPLPDPSDYDVTIKILSKQCFGSAGCNVEGRITLDGLTSAALSTPAELTVRITGSEDGPQIETLELDEDGNYNAPEISVGTSSKGVKLKAKVTDVEAP